MNCSRLIVLILVMVAAGSPVRAGDKSAAKFKAFGEVLDTVQTASAFSEDKLAVSVLCRNLQMTIDSMSDVPVRQRIATISLPIDNKDDAVHLTQDVRGYVSIEGKARAVLLLHAAGKSTVLNL